MRQGKIFIALVLLTTFLTACEQNNESIESETADPSPVIDSTTDAIPNGFYFSSNRTGNYEIYHLVGDQLVNLTSDENFDSWWTRQSPDGNIMLFYRSRVQDRPATGGHNNNYDNASLWSLNLINGELKELIARDANDWSAQGVVDWSPDGTQLIMAAVDKNSNRWNLYSTDSQGLNPVRISKRDSLYLDPSWSPDGSQIVFVAFPSGYSGTDLSRLEVFTADKNGNNEIRLTNDELRDHDPYWSPDGTSIAFETAVDPTFVGVGKWAFCKNFSLRQVRDTTFGLL